MNLPPGMYPVAIGVQIRGISAGRRARYSSKSLPNWPSSNGLRAWSGSDVPTRNNGTGDDQLEPMAERYGKPKQNRSMPR
jgi:hypothetical protein